MINSVVEFSINSEKKITSWNSTIEQVSGYTFDEIKNKEIDSLTIFDKASELEKIVDRVTSADSVDLHHIVLISKSGERKIIHVSSLVPLYEDEQHDTSVIILGHDITKQFRKLKQLKKGYGYLLIDDEAEALSLLILLSEIGYHCLVVFCCNPVFMNHVILSSTVQVVSLDIQEGKTNGVSDPNELVLIVKEFGNTTGDTAVLLLGVEYFLSGYSFNQLLRLVYKLNDIVGQFISLFILHVSDQLIFSEKQLCFLQSELMLLPGKSVRNLIPDLQLYELLKVLHKTSDTTNEISFTMLKKKLKVSFPTIRKHTHYLEEKGFIDIVRKGRKKIVRLTIRGKNLVEQYSQYYS